MDTYPSLPFERGSRITLRDGQRVSEMMNGAPRIRSTFDTVRFDLIIRHGALSQTERNDLRAFYLAHRGQEIEIPWPTGGDTYVAYLVRWEEPEQRSGTQWDVTIGATGRLL